MKGIKFFFFFNFINFIAFFSIRFVMCVSFLCIFFSFMFIYVFFFSLFLYYGSAKHDVIVEGKLHSEFRYRFTYLRRLRGDDSFLRLVRRFVCFICILFLDFLPRRYGFLCEFVFVSGRSYKGGSSLLLEMLSEKVRCWKDFGALEGS